MGRLGVEAYHHKHLLPHPTPQVGIKAKGRQRRKTEKENRRHGREQGQWGRTVYMLNNKNVKNATTITKNLSKTPILKLALLKLHSKKKRLPLTAWQYNGTTRAACKTLELCVFEAAGGRKEEEETGQEEGRKEGEEAYHVFMRQLHGGFQAFFPHSLPPPCLGMEISPATCQTSVRRWRKEGKGSGGNSSLLIDVAGKRRHVG